MQTPARILLLLLCALLFISAFPARPVAADLPATQTHSNASRTVSWRFNGSQGLDVVGAELSGGRAFLPWQSMNVSWPDGSEFERNETSESNLTFSAGEIVLAADSSNHVSNGSFSAAAPWAYTNSTAGNVTASWNVTMQNAVLQHVSPAASASSWDSMDSIPANWTWSATPNVIGGIFQNNSGQTEGAGMLGMQIMISSGEGLFGAAKRNFAVDWSAHNRLILWIGTLGDSSPLAFNVTATVGGQFRTTRTQALGIGWQEVVVNLTELGSPSERGDLQNLMLRINGQSVPTTWVWFDDLRLANAKILDETASVSQSLVKPNTTTALPGSATLSFRWNVSNASGIAGYSVRVELSGGPTPYEATLSGAVGQWHTYTMDVSAATRPAGTYDLRVAFGVRLDNTSVSNATLRIDDFSLFFPNRGSGMYVSTPIYLETQSEFLNVTWNATIPTSTVAQLSLRTGNDSDPDTAGWSSWSSWTTPGTAPLSLPGNDYFQIRLDLETENASLSPGVHSFFLETRHRLSTATITSELFTAPTDFLFLRWRTFNASFTSALGVSISFFYGNGSSSYPIVSGQNITMISEHRIVWQARLNTSNGLQTPYLSEVSIVYEFLGPVDHVSVTPGGPVNVVSGGTYPFQASALDAGSHPVSSVQFAWSTNDTAGRVDNNGLYHAGGPGNWTVTATVVGDPTKSGTARVTVSVSDTSGPPTSNGSLFFDWPFLPLVVATLVAAGLGFAGYQSAIRRMFAIDDVFLISKDGRLIMHNTRRMRADRDEDILSGMLTAILAFLKDSDPEENGELRRFEVGGKTTLLERGDHVYVTSIYSGRVPRWARKDLHKFVGDLEEKFGDAFAKWDGSPEDLQGVKEYMERFVSRIRYHKPPTWTESAG